MRNDLFSCNLTCLSRTYRINSICYWWTFISPPPYIRSTVYIYIVYPIAPISKFFYEGKTHKKCQLMTAKTFTINKKKELKFHFQSFMYMFEKCDCPWFSVCKLKSRVDSFTQDFIWILYKWPTYLWFRMFMNCLYYMEFSGNKIKLS